MRCPSINSPLREPISRSKKSISQKRKRLLHLHATGRVGSRRFQDDFAGGEKRFRRAGGGRGSMMAHGKAKTPPAQDWCSERVFAALSAKSHRGRTPSITKTERRRSANLLQTPRGLMCKLRQRGRGYAGRPAGSRGIDPSLQRPLRWLLARYGAVTVLPIHAQKRAIDDHGGSRFAPDPLEYPKCPKNCGLSLALASYHFGGSAIAGLPILCLSWGGLVFLVPVPFGAHLVNLVAHAFQQGFGRGCGDACSL